MRVRELVSHIAKLEGKTHQAPIGDVREIVGIISDACFSDISMGALLAKNGLLRASKKPKYAFEKPEPKEKPMKSMIKKPKAKKSMVKKSMVKKPKAKPKAKK